MKCKGPSCRGCADSNCYADGGKVDSGSGGSPAIDKDKAQQIEKGATESGWQPGQWIQNVKESVGMAEGGEVEMDDEAMDNELCEAAAGELLAGIEKKDKAQILDSLRAIVLSVR